jgi:ABC-type bacteriocin/lantibiotic exporter with double-glycine peptidase domain
VAKGDGAFRYGLDYNGLNVLRWLRRWFTGTSQGRWVDPVLAGDTIDDACAVLTMMARYHGRAVEPSAVDAILRRVSPNPGGRTASDLIEGAAELGMRGRAIQIDLLPRVEMIPFPCVGHVLTGERAPGGVGGVGYFVFLANLLEKELSIIDPYKGFVWEPGADWFSRSSGLVVIFEAGHRIPRATLRR